MERSSLIAKRARLLCLSLFILTIIIRILLVTGIPKYLLYGPHDDLLYARMAHFILHGQWMGPYGETTLIKAPFYAFFIIFSFFTGLPLLLVETIFYVTACIILYFAIFPLIGNRWWRLFIFELLLFCPASLTTDWNMRVYREFVSLSLTLFVTAFAIGLFLRIDQKLSVVTSWAIGLGLSVGGFIIAREEGVWIFPMLLFLLGICVAMAWFQKLDHKIPRSIIVLSPIIIWSIPALIISWMNYSYYGFWGYSEQLDSDFNQIINNLGRIKTESWIPYASVTKESIEKAYEVSPLFKDLKSSIDQHWTGWQYLSDQIMLSKPTWYRDKYFIEGKEIGGTYFSWLLREAIDSRGYYSHNQYPREYLRDLAAQLSNACDTGVLDCYPDVNIPLVGSIRAQHIPIISQFVVDYFYRYQEFELTNIQTLDIKDWPPYQSEFVYFEELVNNPIDSQYFGRTDNSIQFVEGEKNYRLYLLRYKRVIMSTIRTFYKETSLPGFVIIGIGLLIVSMLRTYRKQRLFPFPFLFILLFLSGLFISRTLVLAIIDATTSAPAFSYSSSNYLFLYILFSLTACLLFDNLFLLAKTNILKEDKSI